eukprot:symbB.v1.2.008623.t1/scaffold516.1/size216213/9
MLPARVSPNENWRHAAHPYPPQYGHGSPTRHGYLGPPTALQGMTSDFDWAKRSQRPPPSWKGDMKLHAHALMEMGDGDAPDDEDDEEGHQHQHLSLPFGQPCPACNELGRHAVHKGAELAKSAAIHIYLHAESSAWTVKGIAFVVSLVLFGVSVLSLFNACVIFIMEGPSEMDCQCGAWDKLQRVLFSWAAFLSSRTGRALFYFFVGTLNMFMMPHDWLWTLIYFTLGSALSFVGVLSLLDRYGCTTVCCPKMRTHVRGKLRETDYHADAIENRGSPHGPKLSWCETFWKGWSMCDTRGSDNASPHRGRHGPRIQEMEQLLDAEMGSAEALHPHGLRMSRKMGCTFGLQPPQPNLHKPGDRYMHTKFEKKKVARLDPSKVPAAGASSYSQMLEGPRWQMHYRLQLQAGCQRMR